MLLIVVGYAHSQTAPSLDMIMRRLEATESELKSYKAIVEQNTAAIETLKQQLEKVLNVCPAVGIPPYLKGLSNRPPSTGTCTVTGSKLGVIYQFSYSFIPDP